MLYRLWNLELGESPYLSSLRADSERIQWEFACRQERQTSGKGKGVHIEQQAKQQSNGVQAVSSPNTYQWREISEREPKALAELELSEDRELTQPLESRLAELKARLHGARPIGQQVDRLRVISKCHKRLAEHQRDRGHRELPGSTCGATLCFICGGSQGRWTGQWDARVACKHSVINTGQYHRHVRCVESR